MSTSPKELAQSVVSHLSNGPVKIVQPKMTTAVRRQMEQHRVRQQLQQKAHQAQLEQWKFNNADQMESVEHLHQVAEEAGIPFENRRLVANIRHALMQTGYRLGLV